MSWAPPDPELLPAVDVPDPVDEPSPRWWRRWACDVLASLSYRLTITALVVIVAVLAIAGGLKALFLL